MSEITTKKAGAVAVSGAAVGSALAGGVALTTGGLIALLYRALSNAGKEAYNTHLKFVNNLPETVIKPVNSLLQDHKLNEASVTMAFETCRHLPPVEALKVKTALGLLNSPFLIENSSRRALQESINVLSNATTILGVRDAQRSFMEEMKKAHRRGFNKVLTHVCKNATKKAGFRSVQIMAGPMHTVRIVGTGDEGRAIVTEIESRPDKEPVIRTEIVGVSDGSCRKLIDAFDKALEEDGVRVSTRSRKFTGGACETAAAREFLRRRIKLKIETDNPVRRTQRLNQKRLVMVKKGG